MKWVLVGSTRGVGRALARRIAMRGEALVLLGRRADDLAASARDLEIRAGREAGTIGWEICDLERPETFAPALDAAWKRLERVDAFVVTAAQFATQEALESDRTLLRRLLDIDFARTVELCEEARVRLLGQGGGTLCVFSSVAGERGRKPVVLYGAAKAGLSRYLEGLDHRFHAAGLTVVTVKPGFVRTGMTSGLPEPPFAADPERVAADVLRAIERRRPVIYTPAVWRLVMAVVRRLPRFLMRRSGF